jgi:hypothetical protein
MKRRKTITCKLTGDEGFGVRAHIVPQALYQFGGNPGKMLFIGKGFYREQRTPIGEYDTGILTNRGGRHFDKCDDFAPRFILNNGLYNRDRKYDLRDLGVDKTCALLDIDENESRLLKLFALSIVWRASVSSRSFFNGVDLGDSEPQFRELILRQDPGPPEMFPVFLGKHMDTPPSGLPLRRPHAVNSKDGRQVRFPLPSMTLQIKIDQTPISADEVPAVVGGASQLPIFLLPPYRESEEGKIVIEEMRRRESC